LRTDHCYPRAAKHTAAVEVALRDKLDLAVGITIGSSLQVSLFLLPLMVLVGWGQEDDLSGMLRRRRRRRWAGDCIRARGKFLV